MKRNVRGFLLVVCLLTAAGAARAATIHANGTGCTLQHAIEAANRNQAIPGSSCEAGSGADVIKLQYDVVLAGVSDVALSSDFNGGRAALPDVTSEITIEADDPADPARKRIIERHSTHGCTSGETVVFRLFNVRGDGSKPVFLHLRNLILRNGCLRPVSGNAYGAAIHSEKPVTVTGCHFERNVVRAPGIGGGGAINMTGSTITVVDSTFVDNEVHGGDTASGSAVDTSGDLTITGSTFRGNKTTGVQRSWGGAVRTWGGKICDVASTVFDANEANGGEASGGGLYIGVSALVTPKARLERLVFNLNKAHSTGGSPAHPGRGGGVYAGSIVEHVKSCLFHGNSAKGAAHASASGAGEGGGLFVHAVDLHLLHDSSFTDNQALPGGTTTNESRGGGLALYEPTGARTINEIRNVTFAGNKTPGAGGAMHVHRYNVQAFNHITMKGNEAGSAHGAGLDVHSGHVHGDNLLAAGNYVHGTTTAHADCHAVAAGSFTGGSFNFFHSATNCGAHTAIADSALGSAGDHGCTADRKLPGNVCVTTVSLSATSTVRDKGGSTTHPDARGMPRPRDYPHVANAHHGNGSDPGAFEDTLGTPLIIGPAEITAHEGTPAAIAPANGSPAPDITDAGGAHFRGGWLEVEIAGAGTDEHLSIANADGIVYDAANRSVWHGQRFGHVDVIHHGGAGAKLRVVDLTEGATHEVMTKLFKAIRYTNHHNAPELSRTIRVRVHDGTIDPADPSAGVSPYHDIRVTVTGTNDAPHVTGLHGHTAPFTEGAHPNGLQLVPANHAFTVGDHDFANRGATHFAGGKLVVTILNAHATHEKVKVPPEHLGTVGTIHATNHGENGQPLHIIFQSNAAHVTAEAVENLIRAVHYLNGHDAPPAAARTIAFELHDALGAISIASHVAVPIAPRNDPPHFNGAAHQPTHAAGGVHITPTVQVHDHEHHETHWGGAKLEVHRDTGAHHADKFTFTPSAHATHVHEGGKLTLHFGSTAKTEHVNALMSSIKYEHTGQAAPESVKLHVFATDSGHESHGPGGPVKSEPHVVTVQIPFHNDRPSIRNVDGRERPYTEETTAVRIVSTDGDVFDPDEKPDFNGGRLTAEVEDATAHDVLSIAHEGTGAGQIAYSGAPAHSVKYANTQIGTATVSHGRLEITFDNVHATRDAVSALLRAITYRSDEPPGTHRSVKFIFNDGDGGTEQVSQAVSVTMLITHVNDRPTLHGLGGEPEYHPSDASPRILDGDATVSDAELDVLRWGGATLTVKRKGGASPTDVFGFAEAKRALVNQHATHTLANGVLTVRFNNSATQAIAGEILQAITYSRADALGANITIEYVIDDRNGGSQGTGPAREHTGEVTVKPRVRTATHLDIKSHAPNPSKAGEAVPVTVELTTTGTPGGTIEVEDGHGERCAILLPATSCTLTPRKTAVTHITARYLGTTGFETSTTSEPHTVHRAPVTVGISAAATSFAHDAVTVSVTVRSRPTPTSEETTLSPASVIVMAARGGVEVACGSATTANHVRTCTLTGLGEGTWTIHATHPASTDYEEGTASRSHAVTRVPTVTQITADAPDFSLVGQSVGVSVRVTATPHGTVTGSVVVSDSMSGTVPCTAVLHNGIGHCALTPTIAGLHSFTASYEGDVRHQPSATAIGEPHEVRELAGRATTVTIRPIGVSSTTFGQSLTVHFDVRAGTQAVGEGDVTVWDRDGGSCRAGAAAGQCVWTPVAAGERRLFATYHGTSTYAPSTSADVTHTVNKAPTTTSILSRTAATSALGTPVTVFVRVAPDHVGLDGAVLIAGGTGVTCTAVLGAAGEGNCALTFTSPGPHAIVATYHGNLRFAPSPQSAPHTHHVSGAAGTGRLKGDVDGVDGIKPADVRKLLRYLIGEPLTDEERCAADFDSDNQIDFADARGILACYAVQCVPARCNN